MTYAGYIYVLINYSMANLVKVGKTTRDSEARAKELSSVTGVPTAFTVAFEAFFEDCSLAEEYVHKKLANQGYRLSANREFFQAPLKEVIKTVVEAQQVLKSHDESASEAAVENNQGSLSDSAQSPWSDIEALAEHHYKSGNYKEAYRLYKNASELGSTTAYYILGLLTFMGAGCLEDKKEALTLWEYGYARGDSRCAGWLCCRDDAALAEMWFIRYLQSDAILDAFHSRACHIWDGCMSLRNAQRRREILSQYRDILLPFKDEIMDYAIARVNDATKKFPGIKPLYLQIANDIKTLI